MNIKKTLLAAALAAFAFSAMPAFASAANVDFSGSGAFEIDQDEGVQPVLATKELEVKCSSFSGSGSFEEGGETGSIEILFHGCKAFGFLNCTTSGQSTGTIVTTSLPFHVEPVGGEPGVLITPNSGHFATFACFGATTKVEGSGVIGTITEPGWNGKSDEATILFSQSGGVQDHLTTDTSGTEYDLTANRSGTKETAAQTGAGILTFEEEVQLTE